tara:strand:- start:543 stop:1898 length:1356 start_codon:yes stop_codon:yes gene_type:complete
MFVTFCKIETLFSSMRRKCQGVIEIDHIRKMVQPALLRLCVALSIATVLVLLLASVPVFTWIAPSRSIFLIVSIVCWGILFVFYSLRQDDPRKIVSAQGPGGDILQIATHHALPKRLRKEKEDSFSLGENQFRNGDYHGAAESFLRALEESFHPATALNAGAVLILIADFERARSVLSDGLIRTHHFTCHLLEAALHAESGVLEARMGNMQEALEAYEKAADLFQREGDGRGRGDVLLNAANASIHRGDWQRARKMLVEAMRAHRRNGGRLGRANAQACRAYIQIECDELDEALLTIERATEIYQQARNTAGLAHVSILRGNAHFKRFELEEALEAYEVSSVLCKQSGDLLGEASAKVNVGNVHFKQDDVAAALLDYEGALEVHKYAGNILGQARTLSNIGSALSRLRRIEEAIEALESALILYDRIGARGRMVDVVDRLIERLKNRQRKA